MYTRIFESILDSSINLQTVPPAARWLWITMLIIADHNRDGVVDMPVARLAAKAGLSVEETAAGLALLGAPDPESRSDVEGGRRIVPIREDARRGWQLVNYEEYRKIASEEARRTETRQRVAAFRERKRSSNAVVTKSNPSEAEASAASTASSNQEESLLSEASPPTPPKRVFTAEESEMLMAVLLRDLIRRRDPGFKEPNMQQWALDIDRIHRLDNRPFEDIRRMIVWSQNDTVPAPGQTFCWANNILSPAKLRKQFTQLLMKSGPSRPSGHGIASVPMPNIE